MAGLRLEIVPEVNPLSLAAGSELPFRVLLDGKPLGDQQVSALDALTAKDALKVRTDAEGRAQLRIPRAGTWLLKTIYIERGQVSEAVRYRSTWASLTFELPAPLPAAGEVEPVKREPSPLVK